MASRNLKKIFLGILISSTLFAIVIYFYLISEDTETYLNSKKYLPDIPARTKLIPRYKFMVKEDHHSNGHKLYLYSENEDLKASNIKSQRFKKTLNRESNYINDDPDDDTKGDDQAKGIINDKNIKWLNSTIHLNTVSLNESSYLSLGMIKTVDDQKIKEDGYKKHAFNLLISNRIGFHRNIPDTRHPLCKNANYSIEKLPKASIIICFYNEAFSVLLRTIYSILERSPNILLQEIILVDDHSSDGNIVIINL